MPHHNPDLTDSERHELLKKIQELEHRVLPEITEKLIGQMSYY